MSLRQALQKLRSETKENHLHDDTPNLGLSEVDFDLNSDFFEEDESWNIGTPVQNTASQFTNSSDPSENANIPIDNAKTHRLPLLQVRNQLSASGDKSFDSLGCSLPLASSTQKLKTFAFSRSSCRDVMDSDDLPPSKKPASEKEITRLNNTQHTSHCSMPSTPVQSNSLTASQTVESQVMKSSTPITTVNNKYSNEAPSLPVTPLSRHSVAKRKFPGPAGLLPKLLPNQSLDDVRLSVPVTSSFMPRSKVTTLVDLLPSSQGDCCDFSGAVWKSAVKDLSFSIPKDTQETSCVAELLKGRQLRRDQKGLLLEKVPFLIAVIKSVVPQGNGACVTLKDPTGEIPATLHARVLEQYQAELIPGSIVILSKVSLFSPSQRRRYLNITINNVLKIYLQNGSIITNEEAKTNSNPLNTDNTPRSTPEDINVIAQDNLMDSVELFNADIDQEWCGFPDTSGTNATTTVTTSVTLSSLSVCAFNSSISNNTNTTTTTTTATPVVTCTTYHDSVTNNSRGNIVQKSPEHMTTNSVVSQFTDGLEDEDLDSLLRDFEEDNLCI